VRESRELCAGSRPLAAPAAAASISAPLGPTGRSAWGRKSGLANMRSFIHPPRLNNPTAGPAAPYRQAGQPTSFGEDATGPPPSDHAGEICRSDPSEPTGSGRRREGTTVISLDQPTTRVTSARCCGWAASAVPLSCGAETNFQGFRDDGIKQSVSHHSGAGGNSP